MKQTNNAIKFLMAQYRAIFKHAYLKGIASAVVLTTGLAAASSANAIDSYWALDGSSVWQEQTTAATDTDSLPSGTGHTKLAGAYDDDGDGIVHGGSLIIGPTGSDGQVEETKITTYGGYSQTSGGLDAVATNNTLTIASSGTVSNTANIIGGWAKATGTGFARAEGNTLTIVAGATISDGGQALGAWASGLNGASAKTNTLTAKGKDKDTGILTLGQGVFGAQVWVDNKATGGNYSAEGNTLDLTFVTTSGGSSAAHTSGSKAIYGGYIRSMGNSDASAADLLLSRENTVNLDSSIIGNAQDTENGTIAANYAFNAGTTNTATQVSAIGSESTGLTISNSEIHYSTIYGGYAENVSGGAANATGNIVKISDSTVATASDPDAFNAIYGGQAKSTKTADTQSLELIANSNQVVIDGKSIITANVFGANIDSTSGAAITNGYTGSTFTASNNSVTIGEDVKLDAETVYGALITADDSGADIKASNNAVTLNGDVVNSNSTTATSGTIVAAAYSNRNGTLTNNTLTINGKFAKGQLFGAFAGSGTASATTNYASALTDNKIVIGTDADVKDAQIWAAYSDKAQAKATNNDVTIQGKVSNSEIFGGAGAESVVTLESSGKIVYNASSASTDRIASDKIVLGGTLDIGKNDTVQISGYWSNGDVTSGKFNTNETTIESTAQIYNKGNIHLLGATTIEDGAQLHALTSNANIKVDGLNGDKSKIQQTVDVSAGDVDIGGLVGGTGSLKLSVDTLNSYLESGDAVSYSGAQGIDKDFAGSITNTSGGVVEFTDRDVVLSDFNFTTSGPQAGKIQVDSSTSNGGSIFRGDNVTVAHKFATNTTEAGGKYENLSDLGTSGIIIEANTLNLGSSSLTKAQTGEIVFAEARAKDEINFNVASSEDGFLLQSKVVGNHYMKTNNLDTKLDYYTALNGEINGDVLISGDGTSQGELFIQNGHWTANDLVTIQDSGALTVGKDLTGSGAGFDDVNGSLPDATLTLKQGLVLDASATGTATVSVSGNISRQYDFDDAAFNPGDDRLVLLDLTNGLTLKGDSSKVIQGKAEVNVSSGGIVRLNASDLNTILNQNDGITSSSTLGAFFTASSGGWFDVQGDVQADFNDFNVGNNGIDLSDYGYLTADSLVVSNQSETTTPAVDENGYTFKALDLGANGTVAVKDFTINDLQTTTGANKPSDANTYASKVILAAGTVAVSNSVTSNNQTLVIGSGNAAHLELYADTAADSGAVSVSKIQVDNGSVKVLNGDWNANNTLFTLSGAGTSMLIGGIEEDTAANLTASGLTMGAGSLLNVEANGSAYFDTADFSKLSKATADTNGVQIAGTLTINGSNADSKDTTNGVKFGAEGSIQIENNGVLKFGSLATNGAILKDGSYTGTTITTEKGYTKIANDGGELHLGLASTTNFDGDAIKALKSALFTSESLNDGVLVKGGLLNIGDAKFDGVDPEKLEGEGLSGYTATWDELKDFSDIYGNDVTNNKLVQTNVSAIAVGDNVMGNYGSFSMADGVAASAQVIIAGDTTLRFAEGNNGYFISNAGHNAALGAYVKAQKSLDLINGGKVAAITLEDGLDDAEKNITTLNIRGEGTTYIASITGQGSNRINLVNAAADTEVAGDISNIGSVQVTNGATLSAQNADIDEIETYNSTASFANKLTFSEANVFGGLVQAKDAVLENGSSFNDDDLIILNEGTFKADTLTVAKDNANGAVIKVGSTLTSEEANSIEGMTLNGTGYLDVGTLELNGAILFADPNYGEKTSVAGVGKFKDGNEKYDVNDAGTLNGQLWIGQNTAVGVGASVADTLDAIAVYQKDGSLQKDKYGSILYLNGQLTVANGSEIALNAYASDEDLVRESLKYTITSQELDQYADLGLGANTAILMTEQAFEDKDGKKTGTAIYFDRKAAVVNGAGGDIILSGTFDASDNLTIFNDLDDNGVEVKGSIDVMTQNGFLYTTLSGDNQGKDVQLQVDKDKAYSIMSEASDPVVETLISYHADRIGQSNSDSNTGSSEDSIPATDIVDPNKGEKALADNTNSTTTTADEGNTTPDTPVVNETKVSGNSLFLNEVVNTSHGAPAESAARLAVYGGAAQAALTANTANTEVIAARLGVGAQNSALSFADNGQGAGLWVAPIYKNHDSDGFSAQGLNYGVDMDLYGLALGGDYTLANGIRVGAMFNVGSGDADGQGNAAAANTSNDFDYWGVAVYGGYSFDALSITADFGYTVVDNDLEATTGMENTTKLTASTDTTALTFGVTGQYKFDFDGLVVAPHAGLRYTYLDMDDYTVKGNEDVASYSADSMGIFSIPVGVAVSKEFAAGEWTVKPSFDLTLTANLGDDSMDGNVTWANVNNLSTHVESEMVDSFTYGASLGVAAKTGNFSLGFGINYTGASNADEYGVNANARFVF